jgi:hypothetical protein
MPNWCQNHLTVTGATPEFRAWLADGFSFQRMSPVSPPAPHDDSAIDSWRNLDAYTNVWGTKCDLDENEQRQVAEELLETGSAFFDTAWSPPIQAIEALSRKLPEVSFQLDYCELGMFFAGTATFQDGECHDDCHEEKASVMRIACDIFGYEDEEDPCESEVVTWEAFTFSTGAVPDV